MTTRRTLLNDPTLSRARRRLLGWYRRHRRDLPWRRRSDAYAIWVAEVMLQQTRVDVVVPYFERFLARYPTVTHLAAARLEKVLHAWSGLGYYSRARNLHAAARCVVRDHGGALPADTAALRALPGIGRYTAGAIASIAFARPAPILDGNVMRVFSRLCALTADVRSPPMQSKLWDLAARWAACAAPGDANQALMELGATVCLPAAPQCASCPVSGDCVARRRGIATTLPRRQRAASGTRVRMAAVLLRAGPRVLLVRRQSGRLLRDWWEVPTWALRGRDGGVAVRNAVRQRLGLETSGLRRRVPRVRHGILSHRLEVAIYTGVATAATGAKHGRRPQAARGRRAAQPVARNARLANLELEALAWRWVHPARCRRLPLSTLTRKILRAASAFDSTWGKALRQEVGE